MCWWNGKFYLSCYFFSPGVGVPMEVDSCLLFRERWSSIRWRLLNYQVHVIRKRKKKPTSIWNFGVSNRSYDDVVRQVHLQAYQQGQKQQQWWLTSRKQPLTHQMETLCKDSNWNIRSALNFCNGIKMKRFDCKGWKARRVLFSNHTCFCLCFCSFPGCSPAVTWRDGFVSSLFQCWWGDPISSVGPNRRKTGSASQRSCFYSFSPDNTSWEIWHSHYVIFSYYLILFYF